MWGNLLKGLGKIFTKQAAKATAKTATTAVKNPKIWKAVGKFAKQTSKAVVKAATTAAKNPKTWKAVGATLGSVALSVGTEKLLAKKNLTPREKLKDLTEMFESGEISEEEYKMVRKKILEEY